MKARELTAELVPPGERLRDELERRGWTQRQLSAALKLSHAYVSHLTTGKRGISAGIALRLEKVLGISARGLLYDQADYDLELARRRQLRRESQAPKEN